VRSPRGKFIRYSKAMAKDPEACDLVADPAEEEHLLASGEPPELVRNLRRAHDAWNARWEEPPKLWQPLAPDRDHVERLRALGYVR
jgi:hypothetical protein